MKRLTIGLAVLMVGLAACGSSTQDRKSSGGSGATQAKVTADPSKDKLAQVRARGTVVLFTDPKYPPQSYAVKSAQRAASTKCAANQLTAPEITGYDAESGKLVAKALGVEACFVTPSWTEVTAGNWGDRWDLAYGSGAIDFDRMNVLYMTQPSYTTPTDFFVPKNSPAKTVADISGKKIGACAGCTMEKYLRGTLNLPGSRIQKGLVGKPDIVTYDTEVPGLAATAKGKLDAFLCSVPVGDGAIKDGEALRRLATPAYYSYKTGYVDKQSGLAAGPFVARVNQIMRARQADGTMKRLSLKFFGADYATKAAGFNLARIGQHVT